MTGIQGSRTKREKFFMDGRFLFRTSHQVNQ
jgi:hypothetical protein